MLFRIDRSKWIRGDGPADSFLYRPRDGKQCCIGQICSQLGVSHEAMSMVAWVGDMDSIPPELSRIHDSELIEAKWLQMAYAINDDRKIVDADREQNLRLVAMGEGHDFEFYG